MIVFIPGFIPPVRFGPGETDSPDGSISQVIYIYMLEGAHFAFPILSRPFLQRAVGCNVYRMTV